MALKSVGHRDDRQVRLFTDLTGCFGREALGVAGEAIWVVPPLTVPDLRHPTTAEEIATSGSVLLFLDRARYRRPTFVLTRRNVSAVAEICRRLDGIPLAIELAAARVATLDVEEIAVRVGDSLGLLTGVAVRPRRGSERCGRRSSGATGCLASRNEGCSRASLSLWADFLSERPRPLCRETASRKARSWTCFRGWWTSRWCKDEERQ